MSVTHRITLQAFLHNAGDNPLADIAFLTGKGGKLGGDAANAHVNFHGNLEDDEVSALRSWCSAQVSRATGSGAIVLIEDNDEPDKFEWHDESGDDRHWFREFQESSEEFLVEFHHLMHW
jgi:hypothetical protein